MEAQELIEREYGQSKNFMTPHVLGRGWISETIAYELSTGSGFNHQPIYGVSLVEDLGDGHTSRRHDLSKGGFSREEARAYIRSLKRQAKNGTLPVEVAE